MKKNPNLQPLLNSSPPTSPNHTSNLTHWLEQWHRLQLLLPSQTAWWPEPWELEYPEEETPQTLKESSKCFSPQCTIEEMVMVMILLNLTDKILANAWTEGMVVEVEMREGVAVADEEVDLIMRAMMIQSTQGHYRIH